MSHVLVIHGGVGTLPPERMTPKREAGYRDALTTSLRAGHDVLSTGGSALDAVVEAVRVMEDSPLFNAGRGSNFDADGVVTMDASVMVDEALDAGAVACVTDVRNPVVLARLVMEESDHAMLVGEGASAFARSRGIERTNPSFFHTDERREALRRAKERESDAEGGRYDRRPDVVEEAVVPGGSAADGTGERERPAGSDEVAERSGTVGAVALDADGHLAAATSTGGMANKAPGRVGDSPIIGAGTWAGPLCAVSCTGWGEYFIRNAAAHDVHARMAYRNASLQEAVHGVARETLERQVPRSGGLVAVDREGNVEMAFNTTGMYRGRIDERGRIEVAIYGDR